MNKDGIAKELGELGREEARITKHIRRQRSPAVYQRSRGG